MCWAGGGAAQLACTAPHCCHVHHLAMHMTDGACVVIALLFLVQQCEALSSSGASRDLLGRSRSRKVRSKGRSHGGKGKGHGKGKGNGKGGCKSGWWWTSSSCTNNPNPSCYTGICKKGKCWDGKKKPCTLKAGTDSQCNIAECSWKGGCQTKFRSGSCGKGKCPGECKQGQNGIGYYAPKSVSLSMPVTHGTCVLHKRSLPPCEVLHSCEE